MVVRSAEMTHMASPKSMLDHSTCLSWQGRSRTRGDRRMQFSHLQPRHIRGQARRDDAVVVWPASWRRRRKPWDWVFS